MQKDGLDTAWLQTTEEVHLLVPTEQEVHKSDLSFQVLPQKLHLAVKGETLLFGDLPESVDTDGMHDMSHTIVYVVAAWNVPFFEHRRKIGLSRLLLGF